MRTSLTPIKIFFIVLFFFSFWLMFHTFSYGNKHILSIADNVTDLGLNIPLVRSFSLGSNWPPQYPLYPGTPIRYHFLFYFVVAMLEIAGLPLDWALNIPSALGFFFLMVMTYLVAKKLFNNTFVAVLSVIFLIFHGSLAFLGFFTTHPLSWQTPQEIVTNMKSTYGSDGGDISIFWSLLVYINQRHLALAYGIVLTFIYVCLSIQHVSTKKKVFWAIASGTTIGMFPYFNQPMLLIFAIIISTYFLVFPKLRTFLVISACISVFAFLLQLTPFSQGAKMFAWYPGYLIHYSLSPSHFIIYWWQNLGLHVFLIPIGFFLAPSIAKKALFPLFAIFIIFNMFKFSPDIANSHKFFKFFLILGGMLSSYALLRLMSMIKGKKSYCFAAIIIFFLTFSGIIDFFVMKNEPVIYVDDIPKNTTALWFLKNTPPDSVVLTSNTNLYNPASIAGRKVFIGWPDLVSSIGYDATSRVKEAAFMFKTDNINILCQKLKENNINYVMYQAYQPYNVIPSIFMKAGLFDSKFTVLYNDQRSRIKIYGVQKTCG